MEVSLRQIELVDSFLNGQCCCSTRKPKLNGQVDLQYDIFFSGLGRCSVDRIGFTVQRYCRNPAVRPSAYQSPWRLLIFLLFSYLLSTVISIPVETCSDMG